MGHTPNTAPETAPHTAGADVAISPTSGSTAPRGARTDAFDGDRTGYESPLYARAFAHEGEPVHLPASGAWLLRRRLPRQGADDATGCYPLLLCRDWSALAGDLDRLEGQGLVSVVGVTDPLGAWTTGDLRGAFPDLLATYKSHHLVDLTSYTTEGASKHHRRNIRSGNRACSVDVTGATPEVADEWVALYRQLARRHGVTGRADLPDDSLRQQLQIPGALVVRARAGDETVGMLLWMVSDRRAYYHLGAFSEAGYELRASYALFDHSLQVLSATCDVALLGAGAGTSAADESDGLVRFKRGWGTFERPAMLVGRVLDRRRYDELTASLGTADADFFPSYRAPSRLAG